MYRLPCLPSNMHVHFRFSDTELEAYVQETARNYGYATAMPNFDKDRIRSPEQGIAYRERVQKIGRRYNQQFTVNVPLYLEPDTSPKTVREGFEQGAWIAMKIYPRGGTTGSEEGVHFHMMQKLAPVFKEAEELGMLVLFHAEKKFLGDGVTEIDVFKREQMSIEHIDWIFSIAPKLRVSIEHVSSKSMTIAIRRWKKEGRRIGATVAPQYFTWNRNRLFQGGMNPADYSIPALKEEDDRLAVAELALDLLAFAGDDSAPHPIEAKGRLRECKGGLFNAPVSLAIYFDLFKNSGRKDWFDRFTHFACLDGPEFYGINVPVQEVKIVEKPWVVPSTYKAGNSIVEPMFASEKIRWQIEY